MARLLPGNILTIRQLPPGMWRCARLCGTLVILPSDPRGCLPLRPLPWNAPSTAGRALRTRDRAGQGGAALSKAVRSVDWAGNPGPFLGPISKVTTVMLGQRLLPGFGVTCTMALPLPPCWAAPFQPGATKGGSAAGTAGDSAPVILPGSCFDWSTPRLCQLLHVWVSPSSLHPNLPQGRRNSSLEMNFYRKYLQKLIYIHVYLYIIYIYLCIYP